MKNYTITVNGCALTDPEKNQPIAAKNRGQAINKWLIKFYGSTFSSRAPYNISAYTTD